jgi:cytochrome-b5 reductase
MPNHLQLLFIASFLASFLLLLTLSNFLSSKLREAGYDISRLILIGLPHSELSDHHIPNQMSAAPSSLLDVRQGLVTQLLALLLAVATSAFIYLKFGRSCTSSFPTQLTASSRTLFS